MTEPWTLTNSGKRVDLIDPKPEQIDINDIAHHLSQIIRFNGAGDQPIVVAEHSVQVSLAVESMMPTDTYAALWGLLHDAHEAYLGDTITPMKAAIVRLTNRDVLHQLEGKFDEVIREALKLSAYHNENYDAIIKGQDEWATLAERSILLPDHPEWPAHSELKKRRGKGAVLSSPEAKRLFLNRYALLRTKLLRMVV